MLIKWGCGNLKFFRRFFYVLLIRNKNIPLGIFTSKEIYPDDQEEE